MGAIENRLRKENKTLKAKLEELRAGINAQYEVKIRTIQEGHAARVEALQDEHAAELQALADDVLRLVKQGEAAANMGAAKMDALRGTIKDLEQSIETKDKTLTSLQAKLDAALAAPKRLRDRLQRLRAEKDKTIKDLRTDLAAEREKNWNTFSPKEERRKAALEELKEMASRTLTDLDVGRLSELLEELE